MLCLSFVTMIKHRRAFLNNFAETCEDIGLDGSLLKANCRNAEGKYTQTFIDLNNEITNNNGQLEWNNNGGYTKSCDFCYLAQFSIRCQCYTPNGFLNQESGVNFWPVRNYYGNLQVKLDYLIIKD